MDAQRVPPVRTAPPLRQEPAACGPAPAVPRLPPARAREHGRPRAGGGRRGRPADPLGAHLAVEAFGVGLRADVEVLEPGGGRGGHRVLAQDATQSGADAVRPEPHVAELTGRWFAVDAVAADHLPGYLGDDDLPALEVGGAERELVPARREECLVVAT